MNAASAARVVELCPQLQAALRAMSAACAVRGVDIEVVQGLRTFALQAALYAQGREPLATVNALRFKVDLAPITEQDNGYVANQLRISSGIAPAFVTYARPGESYHNYGLAADCVPFVDGEPVWTETEEFIAMLAEAREAGLVCGADWRWPRTDPDHLQLTGIYPASPNAELCTIFQTGGVAAVWAAAFPVTNLSPKET